MKVKKRKPDSIARSVFGRFFILASLFLLLIIVLTSGCAYNEPYFGKDNPGFSDAIIIPGFTLNKDGSLNLMGRYRTEWGYTLYKKGYGNYIIFSGGNPKNGIPEARAMKDYLLAHYDIDSSIVITETNSATSAENAEFSMKIASDLSCSSVLVSTSKTQLFYSLYKFRDFASDYGLTCYWKYFDLYELLSFSEE